MSAPPPSEIWLALPAVIVPSASNAGRSLPRLSGVVPGRTPSSVSTTMASPLRCGTSTATISSAKRPPFMAADARSWEAAANSSSRVSASFVALRVSVSPPIAWSVKTSHRPSYAMWSRRVTSPYL